MIDELLKYYEYLVLLIIVAVLFIGYLNARSLHKISKYFSSQQFQITSIFEIDPVSLTETFTIGVFNNNINDSRIVALGLAYKDKNIDYFSTYIKQENLGSDSKIVIPSRDSIRLRIDCKTIKTIIRDFNQGKHKTAKIEVYAIDSLGITTISNSSSIRRNINKMIQRDIKVEKIAKKNEQAKLTLEKKQKRQEDRMIRKTVRKEKTQNTWMKFRAKF